ncbi:MAG: ABC transporter permease [Alkaliphilus sp.]
MSKYIIQRIFALFITLFIIVSILFLVIRLMPGSVYDDPEMPVEILEAIDAKYHLDEPLIVQYGIFIKNIFLEWDWGTSVKIAPRVPVFEVLRSKIPISLSINIFALFIALPVGVIAGIVAAVNRNALTDHFISFLVVVCISVPSFVFATGLQYLVAFRLGWFPIIYDASGSGISKMLSMVLPIMALSFGPIARVARYLRAELAETLNSDFMLLARTKGLTQIQASTRHALRNSLIPLANIIVPMFTNILGGSLVIERIFSIPGVGGMMIESINSNDHPLTIAILLFYSFISLFTVLMADISYGIIDPRVRVGGGK